MRFAFRGQPTLARRSSGSRRPGRARAGRLVVRLSLGVLCPAGILGGTASCGGFGAETAPRPHILLIVADDLGWDDVGYHGSSIHTPQLDALAARGVRSERFYVLPSCSPTRAALLTGRYPIRYGLQGLGIPPWSEQGLPPGETTLAEDLQEAGYATTLIGKWHLGMARPEQLPRQRGFDHHYGLLGGMIDYFDHTRYGGLDWRRDGRPLEESGHATDLLAAEAARQALVHDPATPLFMMLALNAPHLPLQAHPRDVEKYLHLDGERRILAAMVTHMDRAIGRVLRAFEEARLLERTLVVFLSDNGALTSQGASNRPLRGGKHLLTEGGVRVPAVWSWPGELPAGTVSDVPMHAVDLRPTLASLAGASPAADAPLDGRDVMPALRGEAPSELRGREILLDLNAREGALLRGRWKLRVRGSLDAPEELALYDVFADPTETRNRYGSEPELGADLLERLRDYRAQAVPRLLARKRPPDGFQVPAVWGPTGHGGRPARHGP